MSYRVAVASTDGKMVNEHFGRSRQFYIFEVNNDDYGFVELRAVIPGCSGDPDHQGEMGEVVNAIADCKYVLVTRIGSGGEEALAARGIKALEVGDFIDRALEKLIGLAKHDI